LDVDEPTSDDVRDFLPIEGSGSVLIPVVLRETVDDQARREDRGGYSQLLENRRRVLQVIVVCVVERDAHVARLDRMLEEVKRGFEADGLRASLEHRLHLLTKGAWGNSQIVARGFCDTVVTEDSDADPVSRAEHPAAESPTPLIGAQADIRRPLEKHPMIIYLAIPRPISVEMPSARRDAVARLRIVQVVPSLTVGGAELLATRLTLRLMDRAESVLLCSAGGEPFEPVLRDARAPLEVIPRPRPRLLALVRASLALARILRRERPHVIHAHNPVCAVASACARLLARQPQIAIVTTYHGLVARRLRRAALALAASSDVVVGVSSAATRDLVAGGLPADRAATIANGIDMTRRVEPAAVRAEFDVEEAELVVSVGRYVEEKDYPALVDAVGLLITKHPRLRALIVGEGPLDRALQKKIDGAGLGKFVKLTGLRKDAVDIASAADVFVLSSVSEGLPLALLEAMAHGRAVVTTRAGGTPEVIADGENGILVPMANPAALAEAIGRVLDDPVLRTRLGEAGRAYVTRFHSEETMLGRYEELYLEVITKRASGARH